MEEGRKQIFMEELEDAVKQRDELDTFIAVLSKRLGIEPPAGANASTSTNEQKSVATATGDPEAAVAEGQFYGMSAPKAAKALLMLFGRSRPMKTEEIFRAITKGGVQIGNSGTLYRSLHRDDDFHKVGRGLWGLSEWYPASKRQRAEDEDEPADPNGENGDPAPVEEDEDQPS